MARRRYFGRHRRGHAHHGSKAVVAGAAIGAIAAAYEVYNYNKANPGLLGQHLITVGTGYSPSEKQWKFDYFMQGTGLVAAGLLAGVAIHKAAKWTGVNRAMPKGWAI